MAITYTLDEAVRNDRYKVIEVSVAGLLDAWRNTQEHITGVAFSNNPFSETQELATLKKAFYREKYGQSQDTAEITAIEMPRLARANASPHEFYFEDGRHRTVVAFEKNVEVLPIYVPVEDEKFFSQFSPENCWK